jgi:glycosyltransferase involved in cell wall biosynthesis
MVKAANLTGSVSRKAGGLFESVRRLAQSLEETGVRVRVLGTADEFTPEDLASWRPVEVTAFGLNWPESFRYSPRFLRELDAFQPDLTHTHGVWIYPSVATRRYVRKAGIPYLVSPHGMLDDWAVRNSRWKKAIAYFLYEEMHLHGAHCLRALCPAEARAFRGRGLKNPIVIIPNGVDLPDPAATPAARNPAWNGRKVLLYLGRLHLKKGLSNLLRAWAAVQRPGGGNHDSEWLLAVAGWDQACHEDELKALATQLGIPWSDIRPLGPGRSSGLREGRGNGNPDEALHAPITEPAISARTSLVFLGPQFGKARAACYQSCEAFILPSLSEGLPMAVLEAWAYGKPALITPQCNLPEGFTTGAAIRIESEVESIVAGLGALMRAPISDLQLLGNRGRALVQERFTWPQVAAEMKEVYEWMLGGGSPPKSLADF